MKKLIVMLLSFTLLFSLTACGNEGTSVETASSPAESGEPVANSSEAPESNPPAGSDPLESDSTDGKALVVYFSATGNTKAVAETLAELQGADLYEIVPEQPYTDEDLNYNDTSSRASVEQNDETARPAIAGGIDNMADYDVIYVGFPIWWGDVPRILETFFDTYDLSGKVIAPFCTSGGSGISTAVQTIAEFEPTATVTEGLRASVSTAEGDLSQWLNTIALANQE